MNKAALVLGALLLGVPLSAHATVFEDGDGPAQPEGLEGVPPGWDRLSDDAKARLAQLDDAQLQAIEGKLMRGEALTADEQAIADALRTLAVAAFDQNLNYQTGDIPIGGGLAVLHLGDKYRFLGPTDARAVIEGAWNNPPSPEDPLGMIVPADLSPADPRGWGVILSYSEEGHVDDADAESIDYDELLAAMKEATEAENEARKQLGFPAIHLVGWAEPPHYDKERHSLYWAKELAGDGPDEHSLNYAVRVLGRKGVLELNAVSGISQLAQIKPEMEKIYALVEFSEGNRYSDFNPSIDKVAAYGIGGLIAGKIAMKAGLFTLLAKGWKLILLGLLAVGAAIKGLFTRKKDA
ncbi:MAG TPA: DUF2167 domain-containing protein [Nannocystis sp.]